MFADGHIWFAPASVLGDAFEAKLARGWPELPRMLFPATSGGYVIPANVRRDMERVLRAAKLPHFTPHGLRHTFASLHLQVVQSALAVVR